MATNRPLEELISQIGHDGSTIRFPGLEDPQCRQSFHIAEMYRWLYEYTEFRVCSFEFCPRSTPDGNYYHQIDQRDWVRGNPMRRGNGVLLGRGVQYLHAVAWDCESQRVYDPNGTIYDLENQSRFSPHTMILLV